MMTSLRRVFRSGFVGFWRNAYVSLSSVFVITVALFVIGVTIILDQFLTVSLQNLQSKVDINVYFVTTADEGSIFSLKNSLEALPDVASVTYTSREDALIRYKEINQNNAVAMQALEELGDNPLGATLAIQAIDTTYYETIAAFLEEKKLQEPSSAQLIESINYNRTKEAIDKLTSIINAVEQGTLVTMIMLILAAILITFNTIRLAIYTAREEIAVMRLVGASNMFIRGPFLIQGILYGLIAACIAIVVLFPLVYWIGPGTATFLEFDVYAYFISDMLRIFLMLAGIGTALGLVSSLLAIARYLKV
jgi:cell division transport system permease protein